MMTYEFEYPCAEMQHSFISSYIVGQRPAVRIL